MVGRLKAYVMVGTLAGAVAMPAAVAAQGPTTPSAARAARPAPAPRMADGKPDLQGVWNYATATPLERPAELAGKEFLTEEEAARYQEQVVASRSTDRRDGGTQADINRAYNDFWIDWGSQVVGTRRTSMVVDPPDGKLPPLTPEAQKREAARQERVRRPPHGPEDRSLAERCLIGFNAGPPMVTGPYNNNVQIFQTRDHLVILNEMNHNARIVPIDGPPHVRQGIRQWGGDSRAHWEGDTLVVESTNFTDHGTGNMTVRATMDSNLKLIERFSRPDADTLVYSFTVNDPTVWTRPWTAELPMSRSDDLVYEYACHEGNYGMTGMLAGARADEDRK